MLKKLPLLAGYFMAMLSAQQITAQEYQSIPISTGFNADVIANGIGPALNSTSISVDGSDYVFISKDFQSTSTSALPSVGLPTNGFISTAVTATPGLTYQLANYSGNNTLRLADATVTSGTLAFTTPTAAKKLFMLATTGEGGTTGATVTATVTFSDNTTQVIPGKVVPDWFSSTLQPTAISGFGRLGRTAQNLETPSGNPRLYQITLDIDTGNQSKPITNVQINKTTTGGYVCIFALSADAYTTCPSPTNITYVSTISNATVNWTAATPVPSNGYEYYFSASSTAPTSTTTPTGSVATGTSVVVSGLPGQTYYFWVRSNCGGTKGIWKASNLIIGQVTYTYTTGDIGTQHNTAPTVTTVNPAACVGDFTVPVPPGYKIASVATTYSMTAAAGAFMSEQRSLLVCTTSNLTEAAISNGTGSSGGTLSYNRSNLNIANNLTGNVTFQLRAWRTWTAFGEPENCGTNYNKVDNNTWKLIVTYALGTCTTPAAPTAANQNVCPNATYGDLSVNGIVGAVYKWYTAQTGGTELAATTVTTPGTYYVSQLVGTCESPRSAGVVITQNPTPLPTAAPQTLCGGTKVSDLATTSGVNIKWYAAETGGVALAPSTLLATGNYYVSQTVNACESARATVAIIIDTTPVPVAALQVFCAGATPTIANLTVTGTGGTFKWYATETSTAVLPTTTSVGTGTYYVTQTVGVCESYRTAVEVVVATVVAPTIFAQEVCTGATVADLQVTGSANATFKWFATATGTDIIPAATLVTAGTYYVSQTIGTCEGPRASVVVTTNNIGTPVVEAQQLCSGATVAGLSGTAATGATLRWYADATAATPLSNSTALATGTYYVSQKLNNCESDRIPVEITVSGVIPAPATQNLASCIGATFADLVVDGEEGATFNWYASNTTATQIAGATVVTDGTYYVSQTVGTCESARAAVAITYNIIPVATTTSFALCNGVTYDELPVEGTAGAVFTWYASETATTPLAGDAMATVGTAYVSQTIDGCEGERVAVAISLTTITPPVPAGLQPFCGEATVADLEAGAAAGADVNWYAPDGAVLTGTEVLVSGVYTVSVTVDGCESMAMPVTVTVTEQFAAPTGNATQEFVIGATVADLDVVTEEGAVIKYYLQDGDEWIAIPAATPLVDGNTYGVSQSTGTNCDSDILPVAVTVTLSADDFKLTNTVVYPNPAVEVINVDSREALSQVTVINLLGQEVLRQGATANNVQVNISTLPQATYILQVKAASGASASFKIVKQ